MHLRLPSAPIPAHLAALVAQRRRPRAFGPGRAGRCCCRCELPGCNFRSDLLVLPAFLKGGLDRPGALGLRCRFCADVRCQVVLAGKALVKRPLVGDSTRVGRVSTAGDTRFFAEAGHPLLQAPVRAAGTRHTPRERAALAFTRYRRLKTEQDLFWFHRDAVQGTPLPAPLFDALRDQQGRRPMRGCHSTTGTARLF